MSWYGRYGGWGFYPPAPTVEERKAKAAKMRKKLQQDGRKLEPVDIDGRKIAKTFWGKAWCDNIESYQDYAYRLDRGRSYVRSGAVLDLQIGKGNVEALVAGSDREPYRVRIRIDAADPAKWSALVKRSLGRISSLLALTQGKVPEDLLRDFCDRETGLFPAPREMHLSCSCPDVAGCCKHVAAVLYGVGARLDDDPALFFALRSIDPKDLVAQGAVEEITRGAESEIAGDDLSDVFGIALDDDGEGTVAEAPPPVAAAEPPKRKRGRPPKARPQDVAAAEAASPRKRGRPKKATPVASKPEKGSKKKVPRKKTGSGKTLPKAQKKTKGRGKDK